INSGLIWLQFRVIICNIVIVLSEIFLKTLQILDLFSNLKYINATKNLQRKQPLTPPRPPLTPPKEGNKKTPPSEANIPFLRRGQGWSPTD
ncbi:MAG: hypothetical protein LBC74_02260, partial [Planctomycetaceae bacterium]|nr:hypothetical protein [Planctomycetaceae bacterium]